MGNNIQQEMKLILDEYIEKSYLKLKQEEDFIVIDASEDEKNQLEVYIFLKKSMEVIDTLNSIFVKIEIESILAKIGNGKNVALSNRILKIYSEDYEDYKIIENIMNDDNNGDINKFGKSKREVIFFPEKKEEIIVDVGWTANRLEYYPKSNLEGYGGYVYNVSVTEIAKIFKENGVSIFARNVRTGIRNIKSGIGTDPC